MWKGKIFHSAFELGTYIIKTLVQPVLYGDFEKYISGQVYDVIFSSLTHIWCLLNCGAFLKSYFKFSRSFM